MDFSRNATFLGIRKNIFWDDFANAFVWGSFTEKNIEHGYINVLFNYVLVMRYNTISSGIHRFWMSYIDVVQHTSLSWLIHAWPYITKRCSIKLKDEEAEIEMTGSQIKQEAPETNTFKMAEIEADDQWSLRSTMQGARIWLPNIEGFFTSLGRLLEIAEGQRNTASYDSAEFLVAVYEKTKELFSLTLRIDKQKSRQKFVMTQFVLWFCQENSGFVCYCR